MSTPDFTSLSKPQVDALCSVAFGDHGAGQAPRTMTVLERQGLVLPFTRSLGVDRFGPVLVKAWYMPTTVHLAFCEWCAEHIPDPDD